MLSSPRMLKKKLSNIPPYSSCRLDMAGPFNVKLFIEIHNRWVILFTCRAIRAVHLEAEQDCVFWDLEGNTQDYDFCFLDISMNGLAMDTLIGKGSEYEFLTFSSFVFMKTSSFDEDTSTGVSSSCTCSFGQG